MNILLTGTNTYLGSKLQDHFLQNDHHVTCVVRRESALSAPTQTKPNLTLIYGDIVRETYSSNFPPDLDVAYYFSNYTSEQGGLYQEIELLALQNYVKKLRRVHCAHLVYVIPLRSPVNDDVKDLLLESYIPFTIVRTSNVIGKESALIQIFKKISDKFAIISNHQLAKSKGQPIALSDAIAYLDFMAGNPLAFNQRFDIGGPDILSYREMIKQYLAFQRINKKVMTIPFIHMSLSSYWLSKSSGIPKEMAKAFHKNIKGDILCENSKIEEIFPHECLHFKEALQEALQEE